MGIRIGGYQSFNAAPVLDLIEQRRRDEERAAGIADQRNERENQATILAANQHAHNNESLAQDTLAKQHYSDAQQKQTQSFTREGQWHDQGVAHQAGVFANEKEHQAAVLAQQEELRKAGIAAENTRAADALAARKIAETNHAATMSEHEIQAEITRLHGEDKAAGIFERPYAEIRAEAEGRLGHSVGTQPQSASYDAGPRLEPVTATADYTVSADEPPNWQPTPDDANPDLSARIQGATSEPTTSTAPLTAAQQRATVFKAKQDRQKAKDDLEVEEFESRKANSKKIRDEHAANSVRQAEQDAQRKEYRDHPEKFHAQALQLRKEVQPLLATADPFDAYEFAKTTGTPLPPGTNAHQDNEMAMLDAFAKKQIQLGQLEPNTTADMLWARAHRGTHVPGEMIAAAQAIKNGAPQPVTKNPAPNVQAQPTQSKDFPSHVEFTDELTTPPEQSWGDWAKKVAWDNNPLIAPEKALIDLVTPESPREPIPTNVMSFDKAGNPRTGGRPNPQQQQQQPRQVAQQPSAPSGLQAYLAEVRALAEQNHLSPQDAMQALTEAKAEYLKTHGSQ